MKGIVLLNCFSCAALPLVVVTISVGPGYRDYVSPF